MIESLDEQHTIGQAGQGVVECPVMSLFCRHLQVDARLGVEDIDGGDIGECLRDQHVLPDERTGSGSIQVEGTNLVVFVPQREAEHGSQTLLYSPPAEFRETGVIGEIGDGYSLAGSVGGKAGPGSHLLLDSDESQSRGVRGCDMSGDVLG
jgi:hypothetical protein